MKFLVNIDVPDTALGERFYVEAFGFTTGRRFAGFVELLGGEAPVYLIDKADMSRTADDLRDYRRHWTPVHLDIVVGELDRAMARAVAAGAVLEAEPVDAAWGRMARLADPFGHGVCLIQFKGRGYDQLP